MLGRFSLVAVVEFFLKDFFLMKVSDTHKTREDCIINPIYSASVSHKASLVSASLF